MTFAETIKKYRTAARLTQEELAECIGISGQAVSKWETGDSMPDTALLPALADALGVSIDMLFGHTVRTQNGMAAMLYDYIRNGEEAEMGQRMYDALWAAYSSMVRKPQTCWEDIAHLFLWRETPWTFHRLDVRTDSAMGYLFRHPSFTHGAIVDEPEGGYKEMFTEGALSYLEAIGDRDTMGCLMQLLKRRSSSVEVAVLLRDAGIDPSHEEAVIGQMKKLPRLLRVQEVEINGSPRRIVRYIEGYATYLINIVASACAASADRDAISGLCVPRGKAIL